MVKGYFYMFDNKRYITRGIDSEVPLSIQILIWQVIDDLKGKKNKIDYLQIFKVTYSERIKWCVYNVLYFLLLTNRFDF